MSFDRKAYMKKWNAEHRERKAELQRKYYALDPEKFRQKARDYKKNNKEKISEYNALYWEKNHEKITEKRRPKDKAYRALHREEHRISSAKQRIKHREKYKARSIVNHAIRDGRIERMPCEICGEPKTQAHHDDYDKPLDVRWLCVKCHNDWHRNNKNNIRRVL